ncbi:MAG TPA: M15 family metallopeptidase [Parafilimonas sp.]|nr:M15 family metallopeptidase [Parafilimonas sp.]
MVAKSNNVIFKIYLAVLLLLHFAPVVQAQQNTSTNQYGLHVITSTKELQQTIDADSNKAFVHLKKYVPGIVLDMKYATTQNCMYTKMYDKASDMIRLCTAKALDSAQQEFKKYGYGIKIYDSYRPYSVTCYMYSRIPDSNYLAKPWRGSRHNRGITVDMTLIDLKTGEELRMPTPFDCMAPVANSDYPNIKDSVVLRNRTLIIDVMTKYHFKVAQSEWWHYDYLPALDYELLDIPQSVLEKFVNKSKRK